MTVVRPVEPPTPSIRPDTTANYRRRARQLRWRLRGDSSRLIHELRELAHDHPRPDTPAHQSTPASVFTVAVEEALQPCKGSLRYSRRLELLDQAECLGLGRFEANLIIAVCCHRYQPSPAPASTSPRRLPLLACIALVQAAILWGACAILI